MRETIGGGQQPARRAGRSHLRLAVALPFVTGLLSLGIGMYAYQMGRSEATAILSARDAARVWSTPPTIGWLVALSVFGSVLGLAIAVAFTRQLKTLARRTEFIARRNFSFPVELEADGEVAPLVSAINELLESVREYARQSVAEGVVSLSRSGKVLAINPRAAVTLGVDSERIIGASYRELIPDVPANRQILQALDSAAERSEPFDLERVTWVNRRGQRLQVDVQGTVLAGDESIISLLIVFDSDSDLEGIQRRVGQAHQLMIIGGFAAELAHEIRNPLASVLGLVDLLHERLAPGDEGHRHLQVLARAASRIDRLVGQLVDLVPTEIHDLERTDLSELVRESLELVQAGAENAPQVQVVPEFDAAIAPCMVDRDRLGRAIENLIRNAFAHTPSGGTITVHTGTADSGQLEVVVANTGSYVPEQDRERIFQPFVSKRRDGTGLGLAIAQQIAYAHGGSLHVESDPQTGTRFVLQVPAAAEQVRPTPESSFQPVPLRGAA